MFPMPACRTVERTMLSRRRTMSLSMHCGLSTMSKRWLERWCSTCSICFHIWLIYQDSVNNQPDASEPQDWSCIHWVLMKNYITIFRIIMEHCHSRTSLRVMLTRCYFFSWFPLHISPPWYGLQHVHVQVRDINLSKLTEVASTLQDFSIPDLLPTQQFGSQRMDTNCSWIYPRVNIRINIVYESMSIVSVANWPETIWNIDCKCLVRWVEQCV